MPNFEKMYFALFNRLSDAIAALEKGNSDEACAILVAAQQEGEEIYISAEDGS